VIAKGEVKFEMVADGKPVTESIANDRGLIGG
jgi:hypothetical protein